MAERCTRRRAVLERTRFGLVPHLFEHYREWLDCAAAMHGLIPLFAAAVAMLTPTAAQSASVPFTLIDNRIVVEARIDGTGPFAMIVDTGSRSLVVTPAVAQALGLRTVGAGFATGAGSGRAALQSTRVPAVQLGALTFRGLDADVIDLSPIRRAFGFPRLDGIVGYSILRRLRVEVNMDAGALTFSRVPIAAPSTATTTPLTVDDDGLMRIRAAVDGVDGSFIIDTGDRSSLTLLRGFATRYGFYDDAPVRDVVTGIGVGGPIYSDVLRTTVSLFGATMPHVLSRASRDRGGVFATGSDAASVGNGLLKRFNLIYDYPGSTIVAWPSRYATKSDAYVRLTLVGGVFHRESVEPDPTIVTAQAPLPRHAVLGAAVVQRSAGVTVSAVLAGSAAAAAGVSAGDVIVSVGGRPIANVAEFLRSVHVLHAGQDVSLRLARNGVLVTLPVTLGAPLDEHDDGVTTLYESVMVDDSIRRTLLTVPQEIGGRRPAVLLMGGIGCYSIDVASSAQDAYTHLAHDLTRSGFVTMRIEKSGVGDSQGPPCAAVDFDAEQRGYQAALDALMGDVHVDPAHVYLLGHSIGSVIAPRLALTNHVAGVIVAEAIGRDWPEYEIRNLRRQLELAGESPSLVDAALLEKAQCMQELLYEERPESDIESIMPSCATHNRIYPTSDAYVQQVAHLNIIAPWEGVAVPVLAVYGTADFETELADHERIVEAVNTAHSGAATLRVLPDMSHLLGRATLASAFSQGNAGEVYDSDLSTTVIRWLGQLVKSAPSSQAR